MLEHRNRFTHLRGADSDGPALQLQAGNRRAFVGLRMWAAGDSVRRDGLLHRGEVRLECVEVHAERRRVQLPLRDVGLQLAFGRQRPHVFHGVPLYGRWNPDGRGPGGL